MGRHRVDVVNATAVLGHPPLGGPNDRLLGIPGAGVCAAMVRVAAYLIVMGSGYLCAVKFERAASRLYGRRRRGDLQDLIRFTIFLKIL